MEETLERIERLGIVSVMDLDDHWSPGPHHPAYKIIKENGLDKKIAKNLKIAKNITTTTSLFAEEISRLNKNVFLEGI